jgi:hypothetical protein
MATDPTKIPIYHITDVTNLDSIIKAGGLKSDCAMEDEPHTPIGYSHIKERRMKETRISCRENRFVGEFVPFYYCPRSPMLYVVNRGSTGRDPGCQKIILHLVSNVAAGMSLNRDWAISDGNAGAGYPSFYADLDEGIGAVDWEAVAATDWRGITNQKSAEFLVADFFPWIAIESIGCHDSKIAEKVRSILSSSKHQPSVHVRPTWY